MLGGYLVLRRIAEEKVRRVKLVITSYRALESVDKDNSLLKLLTIESETRLRIEPEFERRYENLFLKEPTLEYPWIKGLEKYVSELDEERKRIEQGGKKPN